MPIKTHTDLNSQADAILPDNNSRDISAEDVRTAIKDINDSAVNKSGDSGIQNKLSYQTAVPISADGDIVHKKYVDDAISDVEIDESGLVHKAEDETITGIKTFEVSPIVPEGTEDNHAVNKLQMETAISEATTVGEIVPEDAEIEEGDSIQDIGNKAQGQINALFGTVSVTALQLETINYYNNVIANSGIIDYTMVVAVDKLVADGKRNGWWSKLIDICPFAGLNLAAALTRLKIPSGLGNSLTTYGTWSESDYSVKEGIGYLGTVTSGKYLGTGFMPTAHALSQTNLSILVHNGSDSAPTGGVGGWNSGTNPASGNAGILVGDSGLGLFGTGRNPYTARRGKGLKLESNAVGSTKVWYGSVLTFSGSNVGTVGDLNSEFTLFKVTGGGSSYYSSAKYGFYAIGESLTQAEGDAFTAAVEQFLIEIGRTQNSGGTRGFIGDSVTSGVGTTTTRNRWSYLVARGLELNEYNIGAPSSQLRQNTTNIIGGYQKYPSILNVRLNSIMSMYGINDMVTADVTTDGNSTILADFKTKYKTMLQAFLDNKWKTTLIGIPYVKLAAANAIKQAAYRDVQAQAAIELGIPFVDLYQQMVDTGNPDALMNDNLHPNDAGCRFIADRVIERERGNLRRSLSLDFGSIASGSSETKTVTIYQAATGMNVNVTASTDLGDDVQVVSWVSATNTVSVKVINRGDSAVDLSSTGFSINVIAA